MKLLIGIATYKRTSKLKRCIDSILNSSYKNIFIVVIADNKDYDTHEFLNKTYSINDRILCLVQDKQSFVIGAWNKVVSINMEFPYWDGFIGLCDDVELHPEALEEIVACHQHTFPDTDGVIGFHQECYGNKKYTYKPYGQTLIGRKFIERYKEVNYQICCPFYKHFCQDRELYDFAISMDKFYLCKQAILQHDHPSFTGNVDETHNIIRLGNNSPKRHDFELEKERLKGGKIWGLSWEL